LEKEKKRKKIILQNKGNAAGLFAVIRFASKWGEETKN
jgi:hypothetical protein